MDPPSDPNSMDPPPAPCMHACMSHKLASIIHVLYIHSLRACSNSPCTALLQGELDQAYGGCMHSARKIGGGEGAYMVLR